MRNYFAILQVRVNADPETIRAAYERLAAEVDSANADPKLPTRALLDEAYDVLSDPDLRRRYTSLWLADRNDPTDRTLASDGDGGGKGSAVPSPGLVGAIGGAVFGVVFGAVAAAFLGANALIGAAVGLLPGAIAGALINK